jgi:hypothetical protein
LSSCAQQILCYKTQDSSYLAPSVFVPCVKLFVLCAKLWVQLRFTLYAMGPAFMKSTRGFFVFSESYATCQPDKYFISYVFEEQQAESTKRRPTSCIFDYRSN